MQIKVTPPTQSQSPAPTFVSARTQKHIETPENGNGAAVKRDNFQMTVRKTADDWGQYGQKLGALALVSAGASIIPRQVVFANPNIALPLVAGVAIAALAGLSIEERQIGIGKFVGKVVGKTMGTGVGAAKASFGFREPLKTEPIQLPRVSPKQVKRYEPLLPKALHGGQEMLFGGRAERTQAVEMGELIGATAGVMATSYLVPKLLTSIAGESSMVAAVAGTLVGPLAGMIVGGWEENTLGLGRAAGELVGAGLSKLGVGSSLPQDVATPSANEEPKEPGLLKKSFLQLNKAIAEPIIGPLVDATVATNAIFGETAVSTMDFSDKPIPTVNRERLIKNFVSLTGIYGPSGEEELVGDELVKRGKALGATSERLEDGTVISTIPATPGYEDSPTVLLSAHQDTVEATDPDAIRMDDIKIYTNGRKVLGADDRAGIAQIFEGIQSVQEQGRPHPELKLVFPVDEERGLRGSAKLKHEQISTRPTLGFVVDALAVDDLHLTNDAVIMTPNSQKYTFTQDNPLVQVALHSMAQAGTKPKVRHSPILTGAGSDANTPAFNSGLIQTMAVGVGEMNMHTGMEQIKLNDLERAARHVFGYISNACDLKVQGDQIVSR